MVPDHSPRPTEDRTLLAEQLMAVPNARPDVLPGRWNSDGCEVGSAAFQQRTTSNRQEHPEVSTL